MAWCKSEGLWLLNILCIFSFTELINLEPRNEYKSILEGMRMGWRNEKEQAERDRLMSWKIENHLKTHLFLEFKSKQNNSAFRCKFVYHIKI